MSGPSGNMPPPPPPDTTGATWTPPPPAYAPAGSAPMSQKMSPEAWAGKLPWKMLAFLSQSIGFLLLFVGTVLAIFLAGFPSSCVGTTSCGASTFQNIVYSIQISKFLWALGLLGIGAGAGIHLQFLMPPPHAVSAEENAVYLARRRGEFVMLVLSIGLLFVLLVVSWYAGAIPL